MTTKLRERDWNVLLENIEQGRCIPQLGPDLCTVDAAGEPRNLVISLAGELSNILKKEKKIQIEDRSNLRRVCQPFCANDFPIKPCVGFIT